MKGIVVALWAIVCLGAGTAHADTKPDFTPMKWLVGTFACTGTSMLDGKTLSPIKGSLVGKLDLGDHWLALRGEADKLSFQVFVTWNAEAKQWESYVLDNSGGAETATTTGFSGATATWNGKIHAGKRTIDVVETWEKKSEKELHWVGKLGTVTIYDWTCKKS